MPKDEEAEKDDREKAEHKAEKQRIIDWIDDLEEPLNNILEKFLMDYEALGYASLEIIGDVGEEPVGIAHIPAKYMRVHRDGERYCQIRGIRRAWFRHPKIEEEIHVQTGAPLTEEENERVTEDVTLRRGSMPEDGFAPDQDLPDPRGNALIWISNYTSKSDYYGMPDIAPSIRAILGDLARADYNSSFFKNYGIPAYAVFVTGAFDEGPRTNDEGVEVEDTDPTGRTALERAVLTHFTKLNEKPYSTLFMSIPSTDAEEGEVQVTIQKLGHDIQDASFQQYRTDNRDEVLSSHGVPAERAGIHIEGSLGGNFAREATEIYKTSILEQRQEMVEHALNKYIFRGGLQAKFWKFKLKEIDNKDKAAEHGMDLERVQNAIWSPNEYREKWGMPKIDDPSMDMHYFAGVPVDAEEGEIPAAMRKPDPAGGLGVEPNTNGRTPPRDTVAGTQGGVRRIVSSPRAQRQIEDQAARRKAR